MDVFLDKEAWEDVFSGFDIIDAAIQDKNIVHLCAKKTMSHEEASHLWDSDIETRIIALYLHLPVDENCGYEELSGMGYPVLGVSRHPFPIPLAMISSKMSKDGDIWPRGSGINGPLESIAPNAYPGTSRLKCINGFTYSVGIGRKLYKRVGAGKWVPFNEGFPKEECTTKMGFADIDAFSESDMYAVGGHGDVWHFNGTRWKQMGFPTNVQLGTVTCAGDGNVYISGEGGSLWVGEKSTWKQIYQGGSSILWNDILWFQDKLWLASDYQFRQLKGKALEEVVHEGEKVYMNGHMDAHDGLLVVAGSEMVRSFDGNAWRTLVAPYLD